MNLRGIYFELKQNDNRDFFNMVTSPISFDQYNWFVKHLDAYSNFVEGKFIDIDGGIVGSKLQSMVEHVDFCMFGKFIGFPSSTEKPIDIRTYDGFLQSNATSVVILIYDVYYYDIYCKDETLILSLADNAKHHGLNFELIDETNDTRTGLDVW